MKRAFILAPALILLTGCFSSDSSNPIVSQTYVHKYGFDVSAQEWEERDGDGQIVEVLKNGVRIVRSYENGVLHGKTTYSFPHSSLIEKLQVFDQGTLLKEMVSDASGVPMREDVYEFDNRTITTLWDEKGAPLSIEEYNGETLVNGKYYTTAHELEAEVENGFGERTKRDRSGLLISRDTIREGLLASRTTYHPTGELHTISHYNNYQLDGEQLKFSSTGKPLMKLHWDHGTLNGPKVVFRNGYKIAEIPYVKGHKEGTEIHFDDLGNLTAEIQWQKDKKHGLAKFFTDDTIEQEWYYKGQAVTKEQYDMYANRDRLVADLRGTVE